MLVAALSVVALFAPSAASAWTPEECQAWYEEHGTVHPDCQPPPKEVTVCRNGQTVTIPETEVVEGDVPGECVPPKTVTVCRNGETITIPEDQVQEGDVPDTCAPPPPTPPPPVSTVPPPPTTDTPPTPPTTDTPPEEQPPQPKEQPKQPGPGEVHGQEEQKTPPQPTTEANGNTLPFTGGAALWLVALLGAGVLAAGVAARRLTS